MPASKKTVPAPRPKTRLSHLLLQCRFDFQNRSWSLPVFDDLRQADATFQFFRRQLLLGGTLLQRQFSDPTKGGFDYIKPNAGRIGIRRGRLLVK